jgi:general secretion pathway protein G
MHKNSWITMPNLRPTLRQSCKRKLHRGVTGKKPLSISPARAPVVAGFTLVEVMISIAIVAVLAAIAFPSYTVYMDKSRNATATSDIIVIDQAIERYFARNNALPNSLADVGLGGLLDPWERPYRYLKIAGSGIQGKGSLRKDKALNPVNSDYDLYSMGKDGATQLPFTNPVSFDDIVRCNNGRYVGLAEDY